MSQKLKRGVILNKILSRWQLYLMLLIPVIYLLIFQYYPLFGLQIAFKNYNLMDGIWHSPWVGFRHFEKFFNSYQFVRVVRNTLVLSIYRIFLTFPCPILFALCLNLVNNKHLKKIIQTTTYIPHFISVVVIVGIIIQMLNPRIGAYGHIFHTMFGEYPPDLLGNPNAFKHIYVWSGVWQNMGWSSIIYLAALSGVDMQLHEAAIVDGASRWKRIWVLDFPTILPTTIIMLIMEAGRVMSLGFEKIFLLQNDLNLSQSEVISTYVYNVSMGSAGNDFSYGTAIGIFNSVINLILITSVNWIAGRVSETSLW